MQQHMCLMSKTQEQRDDVWLVFSGLVIIASSLILRQWIKSSCFKILTNVTPDVYPVEVTQSQHSDKILNCLWGNINSISSWLNLSPVVTCQSALWSFGILLTVCFLGTCSMFTLKAWTSAAARAQWGTSLSKFSSWLQRTPAKRCRWVPVERNQKRDFIL